MGFQSSFNQALGIVASASLGGRYVKGQKESLAEQKMQGKFNVEREINREQEMQEVADSNLQSGTGYIDKNEMMADRAGQALANETNSKKETSKATRKRNRENWIREYMEWYGENSNIVRDNMSMSDEAHQALIDRRKYRGGNK